MPERGLPQAKLRQLAQATWIGEHLNVLITAPTGVGKSYLACALPQLACRPDATRIPAPQVARGTRRRRAPPLALTPRLHAFRRATRSVASRVPSRRAFRRATRTAGAQTPKPHLLESKWGWGPTRSLQAWGGGPQQIHFAGGRGLVQTPPTKISPAVSYSPTQIPRAVPSALRSLTSEFGMGSGVASSIKPPESFGRSARRLGAVRREPQRGDGVQLLVR